MHLAEIDLLAAKGNSAWHKASPVSKLLFAGVALSSVVASRNLLKLLGVFGFLLLLMSLAGVSLRKAGHFMVFPALFALIFGLTLVSRAPAAGALIFLKSVTASSSLLLLVATTEVSSLVACLSFLRCPLLVDSLLLTYRSVFILVDKMDNLLDAVRVKSGRSPVKALKNLGIMGSALGALFIYALDTGERMHKIMQIRGYKLGISINRTIRLTWYDLIPSCCAAAILIIGVLYT